MATPVAQLPRTRRWTRVEYDRLIELGVFRPDERLELLDGLLVVREPQGSRHAAAIRRVVDWIVDVARDTLEVHREPEASAGAPHGWRYRSVRVLRPPEIVAPLVAPGTTIRVAELVS